MDPITLTARTGTVELDAGARTIAGTITAFEQVIRSHGLLIHQGALGTRQPLRAVKLLRDHDHGDPLGYMVEISDDMLTATFHVAEGDNGDRALAEAEQGLRDGLSVGFEIHDYSWDDAGVLHVHAGEIYETSLCAIPAVNTARVTHVAAAFNTTPREDNTMPDEIQDHGTLAVAAQPAAPAAKTDADQAALAAGPDTAAQAPATATPRPATLAQVTRDVAVALSRGDHATARQALALSDFVPADDGANAFLRDDWRGELWTANRDDRPMIEALGQPSPLQTGSKVKGYRWSVKPDVQDYAGSKAAVPSNKPKTVPAEAPVHRSAGGWDIDRIMIDLGDPAFLEAFWQAAVSDYKTDSETYAAGELIAGATDAGASATLLAALGKLGATFASLGASLDAVFIAPDLFEVYAGLTQAEVPFWLANATGVSLKGQQATVADLSIRTHAALAAGQVLAFDKRAATYYENTPPIRVNAVDLPKGGIDLGLFGYDAVLVNDPRALVTTTVGAGGV